MKLYQAILFSLFAHAVLLLPQARQSLPEISVAPMQVSLASGETRGESSHFSFEHESTHDNEEQQDRARNEVKPVANDSMHGSSGKHTETSIREIRIATARASREVIDPSLIRTATSRLTRQQAQTRVVSRLHHELKNYFVYPMLARRNGWEGKVVLALDVYLDGRIYNIQLKSGSGHRILDSSALNAVSRIRSLPDVPHWQGNSPLNIALPVIYRLQG